MSTTPNLGLTLPTQGTANWDTPINGNFSIIDSLVAPLLSPALSGAPTAPTTTPGTNTTQIATTEFVLANSQLQTTSNGAIWITGQISELITLSTSGTTTDSSANLLPANSIIEAVVARITTTIVTATNWKLGDATISGRFSVANSTLTAGTTQVGTVQADQTGASGPRQVSAAKLRVTTTGTPSAGAIRVTVFYRAFVPPQS